MTLLLAPILFIAAQRLTIAAADDPAVPYIDRMVCCATIAVNDWGGRENAIYFIRARTAVTGFHGQVERSYRSKQWKIYGILEPFLSHWQRREIEDAIGPGGLL